MYTVNSYLEVLDIVAIRSALEPPRESLPVPDQSQRSTLYGRVRRCPGLVVLLVL